jgi:hypothetical protein
MNYKARLNEWTCTKNSVILFSWWPDLTGVGSETAGAGWEIGVLGREEMAALPVGLSYYVPPGVDWLFWSMHFNQKYFLFVGKHTGISLPLASDLLPRTFASNRRLSLISTWEGAYLTANQIPTTIK